MPARAHGSASRASGEIPSWLLARPSRPTNTFRHRASRPSMTKRLQVSSSVLARTQDWSVFNGWQQARQSLHQRSTGLRERIRPAGRDVALDQPPIGPKSSAEMSRAPSRIRSIRGASSARR